MTLQSNKDDLVITGISTKFPERYLSQHINDKSPNEQNQPSGCSFDPHCPECIRELWGPLLSPFAYLIKQNAQYFNEILMRIGQYKINTTSNSSSKHLPKFPKLEYEDHKFLTGIGLCALHITKVSWLITWTFGFLLLIIAFILIILHDSYLPPLLVLLSMKEATQWGMKFTLQLVFIIISLIGIGKMLASVLGLFGTVHRTVKLMIGTVIFISILILFETGLIVYVFISWSELISDAENALKNSFHSSYGGTNKDQITITWDRIFQIHECCGWLNSRFNGTPWSPPSPDIIPYSCCRPGAPHPSCEFSFTTNQNYADQPCQVAIQEKLLTNINKLIALAILGIILTVEIISAIVTYLYSSTLKTARRRRRYQNEKLINKFKKRLVSYTEQATDTTPTNPNENLPRQEQQPETNDLRQLYNQYAAFHQTPPDIDPNAMSITPSVIQVKRPDVYSYFYYE
ncbi:unnamed protein product [Adineta steineri]|uniref:Tetraspanin n=1 Tax=Adineta steineri TaxID=433720 RepID=A0A818QSA9_9BILA|nr:unnamed protein product [Adineta steineri]